jgi:hypothetical protein
LSARNSDILIIFVVFDGWGVCGSSHSKGILKPDSVSDPTVEITVVDPDPGGQK